MRENNLLLFSIFLLYISGCGSIPSYDETWSRWGEDQIEVRKALLECGASSPFLISYRVSIDTHTYISACMLVSGFRQKDESALLFREYPIDLCNPSYTERPSICDTAVPSRNIERRLNSNYCKVGRRKETDPVPWECLP